MLGNSYIHYNKVGCQFIYSTVTSIFFLKANPVYKMIKLE